DLLGLSKVRWVKGSDVDKGWSRALATRETVRPRRVWLGPNGAVLPVFVAEAALGVAGGGPPPGPGMGRGERAPGRVRAWAGGAPGQGRGEAARRGRRRVAAARRPEGRAALHEPADPPAPRGRRLRRLLRMGHRALVPRGRARPAGRRAPRAPLRARDRAERG